MVLEVILAIIVGVLCYLAIIIFYPDFSINPEIIEKKPMKKNVPKCRQDVAINIDDTFLSVWLYVPKNISEPLPCVVLSTGFGGTKDVLLEQYALRFVENGIAAITYDYRYFGESGGEPRQLFNGKKQQEDLKAVVSYARKNEKINPDKIVLWSTSASGGYGINVASLDKKIAGVIAQCPSLDHSKDDKIIFQREGLGYFIKLFMHAQRDKGRSRFGLSPHYMPIVGRPGKMAFLNAPEAFEGYGNIFSESETFVNRICARSLLIPPGPDPINTASSVRCPVLIIICEKDTLVSPDSHERVAEILGHKATIIKYPTSHFGIYSGKYFEKAVAAQIEFIKRVTSDFNL
jgi:fermentation-respiration switch protein FrsA (DUF1100 family)